MRKRGVIIFLVVSLIMTSFAFGAGTQEPSKSSGPVTIRYMNHADLLGVEPKAISLIAQMYPNVKAEYIPKPEGGGNEQYHDKMVTMLAAGDSSVDMFTVDVVWPAELVAGGWLLPLNDVFPASEQSKYVRAYIDAFTINGKIYGVPNNYDSGVFLYRKDILQNAGVQPPQLWTEMADDAMKLQTKDMSGFIAAFDISGHLYCNYLEFVWSNNGEWLENMKKVRIQDKESVEAVNFMLDLMYKYKVTQPGITSMGLDDGRALFTGGKGVFHRNWLYAYGLAQSDPQSTVKDLVGVSSPPHFKGGKSAVALGGWAWVVNKNTKNPELAKKVAVYMGGRDVAMLRTMATGNYPALRSAFSDPAVIAKYPQYPEMLKVADSAHARAQTPYYTELSDVFTVELHNIMVKNKTVDQGLADAAKAMQEVLDKKQ